jgi:hypothetical protein
MLAARSEVKEVVERLDEKAFDMQDQVEAGKAEYDDYVRAFRRARAVASLEYALDPDAVTAAAESCYEAVAATDDVEALVGLAESLDR